MTEPGSSLPPPGTSHPAPSPPPPPGAGRTTGVGPGPQVEDDLWSTTRIHAAPAGRDPTPPYVRRMRSRRERAAAAAARPNRRGGPSAGVIAGVIAPILFLVIGTAFIAAALNADQDDDIVLQPSPALESGAAPVNETAPPPVATPPPTAAPVPETTIAPETTVPPPETTLAPDTTVPPPETTLAPETTVPSSATPPEVAQAVGIADAYLAAIVSGDYATALQLGREGLTEAELADAFPGIVAGRAELIDGGPPGPSGVPLRLLLVTEHALEGEPDAALTCVRWDVNAGVVTEVFTEELFREPGTVTEPQLVQARIDCDVLPMG